MKTLSKQDYMLVVHVVEHQVVVVAIVVVWDPGDCCCISWGWSNAGGDPPDVRYYPSRFSS